MAATLGRVGLPPKRKPLETKDPEFRKRIDRFAALRAARRAMSAPMRVRPGEDAEGDIIRTALEHLVARPNGDPQGLIQELGGIDTILARYARSLRASFAEVPVPQLRATLPAVARTHRDEVIALVELLLEDEADLEPNLPSLDYVLTLLCFEDGYERRQVVHDPVLLSPRIHAVCERYADSISDSQVGELELRFYGFGELDIDRGDVEQQISELRDLKKELGARFLHPRVLRAVVSYNVSVWNRLERFLETERADDPIWVADADAEHISRVAHMAASDGEASFLKNSVIAAIALFVKQRLRDESVPDSLIARVAKRLDLSRLEEAERSWLVEYEPSAGLDFRAAAVLLGLLLEVVPVAADELEEIGIDPRVMQFEWVREVDGALRNRGKQALGERNLERACAISETRTRFIHEPLLFISKTLRDHYRPKKKKKKRSRMRLAIGRGLVRDLAKDMAFPAWRVGADLNAPTPKGPAFLALILVGTIVWAFVRDVPGHTLADYDRSELSQVSMYLTKGYRDGEGEGPLFVGHVEERWTTLSAGERRREAQAIIRALSSQEVKKIMVYGPNQQLLVQAIERRIIYPPELQATAQADASRS